LNTDSRELNTGKQAG